MKKSFLSGPLAGAAFLMATSAIGPGFITQTTKFTEQLKGSFGFVILVSVLLDIGVQLNIWRLVGVSKLYAQDLANKVFPGAGYLLSALILLGGLAFNIGNIAGAGLGLQVLTGCSVQTGATISCIMAAIIFSVKEAGSAMDVFTKVLGFVMIGLTLYVAFESSPPMAEAVLKAVVPDQINELVVLTIVGGTVGGYISFAGIHRLLDAGISGEENIHQISKSSVSAILIASLMRTILFIAALGIVWKGISLGNQNPAAVVFESAAGKTGYRIFGLVLWSAAITSVVGSAFTSVSFIRSASPWIKKHFQKVIIGFIFFSTIVFLVIGEPVKLLLAAGAVNGLILPFALAIILTSSMKEKIFGTYRHSRWQLIMGWLVVGVMLYMGVRGLMG
ncbi:MAG: putative metal ion transporter YcsG, Mn(2+)/Fe(2+) NRAMP family [Cytophagales bacterium]|jgi:Mn2+/Fe2+ NRAMP family transporter|nr:divalent metal cation transporter [Bacteroidota bacterium]MBS1981008.1 divalent metal cation transporter [Bacteroidota bacterium]WHZ08369.1 MAG: putative metal ion transporter YcsG, Mn(2+)/Fe(2+) NRAMP family [Cytophagales bacterium]